MTFTLNGTYFLRNLQTELYADIQNGTMSNGNEIEQQTFDGANTQKWVFTHIGSSVYTIRSSKNNAYYLGIQNDSTADGANIVLRTGTLTSGMKWRIEDGNEGYKIVSYADSTMVLATNSSNSTPGQKLILGDYVDNDSYRDEWLLSLPSSQVQLEGQETSMWCWVASARMMSFRYQNSPITQACAAVYVKLNNKITMHPDAEEQFSGIQQLGGTVSEIKTALEYITGVECYSAWKSVYSEQTLQSLLDDNIPVIITRGVYNDNAEKVRTSGHATVITSYRWSSTLDDFEYLIYDPWPVSIGNRVYMTYDQIYNGVTENFDNSIWDGVVTFQQGDYSTLQDWSGI